MSKTSAPVKIEGVTITPEARQFIQNLFGPEENLLTTDFPEDTTAKMYIDTLVKITFLLIGISADDGTPIDKNEIQGILHILKCMHKDFSNIQNGMLNWLKEEKENN